jgi:hypothetical protein
MILLCWSRPFEFSPSGFVARRLGLFNISWYIEPKGRGVL